MTPMTSIAAGVSGATTATPVEVHGLTKRFGNITALSHVTLSVPENTIYGVLGPNGAGKTTFFSLLTGFILPNTGTIRVLGTEKLDTIRGRLSILPQDALFQTNIPIIDQLSFFLTLMGYSRPAAEEEVLRVLRLVDLDQVLFREAGTLSHGMYKRLAIAQAFLGKPEVIILDEPTSGLDWKNAEAIRSSIKRLKEEATVLVSSHNLEEMQDLCEHIAILDNGELVASGPVDVVTGSTQAIRMTFRRDLSDEEIDGFRTLNGVEEVEKIDDEFQFIVSTDNKDADDPGDQDTTDRNKDDKTADEDVVRSILQFALSHDLTPRRLAEENRLKRLYLKVTE